MAIEEAIKRAAHDIAKAKRIVIGTFAALLVFTIFLFS